MAYSRYIYTYPVNALHSTVLGYSPLTKYGRSFWDALDWEHVQVDSGKHAFNPAGGYYLHVSAKLAEGDIVYYRVRCAHEIGTSWRRGVVKNVGLAMTRGEWEWVVTVGVK